MNEDPQLFVLYQSRCCAKHLCNLKPLYVGFVCDYCIFQIIPSPVIFRSIKTRQSPNWCGRYALAHSFPTPPGQISGGREEGFYFCTLCIICGATLRSHRHHTTHTNNTRTLCVVSSKTMTVGN